MTLIETALATIIVGVGVLAIMVAQEAFHQQNMYSVQSATATRLGNEIRELTLNMPRHDPVTGNAYWGAEPNETTLDDFNDLDDFDGLIFSAELGNGPINSRREVIPNMNGWAQTVLVDMVNSSNINEYYPVPEDPEDYPEDYLMRVTVIVTYQGSTDPEPHEITRVSWISAN
ncbi:MAG: hypothetical protein EA377_08155 [Phycisphaerales bacterium]|nr:MAG: hypothetical protein EA377_08155 [Phycisphaerales bacterium]